MATLEFICARCGANLLVGGRALKRLDGKRGRVTCKSCGNKVELDGTGGRVVVTSGALERDDDEPTVWQRPGNADVISSTVTSVSTASSVSVLQERPTEDGSLRPHSVEPGEAEDSTYGDQTSSPPRSAPLTKLPLIGAAVATLALGAAVGTSLGQGSGEPEQSRSKQSPFADNESSAPPPAPSTGLAERQTDSAFSFDEVIEGAKADAEQEQREEGARRAAEIEKMLAHLEEEGGDSAPRIASAEGDSEMPEAALGEFDRQQAEARLEEAAVFASACERAEDPTGEARVVVTFAPSGEVVWAAVKDPKFTNTRTGTCIANHFRNLSVPPFRGERQTMSKKVRIH